MKLKLISIAFFGLPLLSACSHEHGSIALDKIESSGDYQVKIFFHSQEKGFDVEANYFSCVSGDGNSERFYQERETGIWTFGKIESLGGESRSYRYVANMDVYYYNRKSNSFGNGDKNKVLTTLINSDFLTCRVVLRNYYRAPGLTNGLKINGKEFSTYFKK
ncbi:hypothetical protein [Paraburkholderia sp. J76]|uniref:hypothetical protein n=1 Tax=Paraburkholderia sp. J76 TaxID=2805439 RepID=UPI002ABE7B03|nr:hypothetical protein [Paraburkholderia sp. J76]